MKISTWNRAQKAVLVAAAMAVATVIVGSWQIYEITGGMAYDVVSWQQFGEFVGPLRPGEQP